jgi:hypothetical protein
MCYVKRATSPSTENTFTDIDYIFPSGSMNMSWAGEFMPSLGTDMPSPVSESQSEPKRKAEVSDELALKRKKNKEAAARSRERKLNKLLELEAQVKVLENEKTVLSLQLAISESEKNAALLREEEYKTRIQKLEEYLYKN